MKKFSDLVDAYVKAVKAKDEAQDEGTRCEGQGTRRPRRTPSRAKIKPEEMEAFGKYMTAQSQKLMEAATAATK